ncbi:twin-arginine translocase TatA/TatE family subunit [Alkalibacter mobilis]|uniref:twin-arginine translocase TatA/TatE family subunit n=1 Tax=Alkalibacter mobilis TaxID=2787712 RepID=UPI00189CAA46|nr:twin-arginine translocase TatA/TatE family subunit [Alkalibacter mobilis]MBF7096776.1 twin-arginine translocase TatA/TatE family subunit [Alkalibacter mobilis]
MFGRIGTSELLIILGIALIVFGPKQLPKLGRTFGATIKSFKDGVEDDTSESEMEKS